MSFCVQISEQSMQQLQAISESVQRLKDRNKALLSEEVSCEETDAREGRKEGKFLRCLQGCLKTSLKISAHICILIKIRLEAPQSLIWIACYVAIRSFSWMLSENYDETALSFPTLIIKAKFMFWNKFMDIRQDIHEIHWAWLLKTR